MSQSAVQCPLTHIFCIIPKIDLPERQRNTCSIYSMLCFALIDLALDVTFEVELTLATRTWTPSSLSFKERVDEPRGGRPIARVPPASFRRERTRSEENESLEERPFKTAIADWEEEITNNSIYSRSEEEYFDKPKETKKQQISCKTCYINPSYPLVDPWKHHRGCVQKAFAKPSTLEMECEGEHGCEDGHGCEAEVHHEECQHQEVHQQEGHGQMPFMVCLEEFLAGLHLGHLADYFRVLGCAGARDLRLLETWELEAVQLVSRRRLLQQLDSLKLHHEDPPEDCTLEGWLTWFGLTHVSGFLLAIGVHSVEDLAFLKKEDLVLLKPVTRRKILWCSDKSKV